MSKVLWYCNMKFRPFPSLALCKYGWSSSLSFSLALLLRYEQEKLRTLFKRDFFVSWPLVTCSFHMDLLWLKHQNDGMGCAVRRPLANMQEKSRQKFFVLWNFLPILSETIWPEWDEQPCKLWRLATFVCRFWIKLAFFSAFFLSNALWECFSFLPENINMKYLWNSLELG